MRIQYVLSENNVTADPNDHAASVQMTDTSDLDALTPRMIERAPTTTRTDILAVTAALKLACQRRGGSVGDCRLWLSD